MLDEPDIHYLYSNALHKKVYLPASSKYTILCVFHFWKNSVLRCRSKLVFELFLIQKLSRLRLLRLKLSKRKQRKKDPSCMPETRALLEYEPKGECVHDLRSFFILFI